MSIPCAHKSFHVVMIIYLDIFAETGYSRWALSTLGAHKNYLHIFVNMSVFRPHPEKSKTQLSEMERILTRSFSFFSAKCWMPTFVSIKEPDNCLLGSCCYFLKEFGFCWVLLVFRSMGRLASAVFTFTFMHAHLHSHTLTISML